MGHTHDDWDSHWNDYADSAERNPSQKYRRRLTFAALGLERAQGPVQLLDIGSGQGDWARDAWERYPQSRILGLELSQAGVDIASRKVPNGTFIRRNLMAPERPAESVARWATHAVCSEVLEHVDDPERVLINARDYMAPGCRLVVTVPGGPMSAFEKYIGHRQHFTPSKLRTLLQQSGFEVEWTTGAGFPFFNLYKCAGYLRGQRLIEDVRKGSGGQPASRIALAAMAAFDVLFHLNVRSSPWGWQMIAKARSL
jgi:SAM-dependent methyltransferase